MASVEICSKSFIIRIIQCTFYIPLLHWLMFRYYFPFSMLDFKFFTYCRCELCCSLCLSLSLCPVLSLPPAPLLSLSPPPLSLSFSLSLFKPSLSRSFFSYLSRSPSLSLPVFICLSIYVCLSVSLFWLSAPFSISISLSLSVSFSVSISL